MVGYGGCNGSDPYANYIKIYDWYDLDDVRDNLNGNYTLMNDLDANSAGYTELASPTANGGKGWKPIRAGDDPFTGTFDGQEYQIEDLFINRPTEDHVGLFAYVGEEGVIENVGMVNVDMTGEERVGGLVGLNYYGTVINSYSTGSVSGGNNQTTDVGGLVGFNFAGTVINSYSTGSVTGYRNIGGLVGDNGGTVSNSYSTGCLTGGKCVGGLVGLNQGIVSDSYSSGNVTGDRNIGGLVGDNFGGTVNNSYSNGTVTGYTHIGGLVGHSLYGTVSNSYSIGNVTGNDSIGGLVGGNFGSIVNNSYFTGCLTGEERVGGLVGEHRGVRNHRGAVSNSYYNYDEVSINGENIITIGALFSGDFEQWLANDKFLDVNERLSQENGYYVINNITDFKELLAFGQDNSLKFKLKNDIDLATEPNFYIPYLAGEFGGNGHKISNLSFNFGFVSHVGLFGYLALDGKLTQVAAEDVNITGYWWVGGLVGANGGSVNDSYSTGSVTGKGYG
jgi:hypothetical protein